MEDVLFQLDEISEHTPDAVALVMPWDYVVKDFETDSEYRSRLMEQEMIKESNLKITDFEQRMEKKHADLVANLDRWSFSLINALNQQGQSLSYAGALMGFNASVPVK